MVHLPYLSSDSRGSLHSSPERVIPLTVIAGLLLWSVLQQSQLGLWDDVTHLIDLSARLLDGQRPYVDWLMDNPPASILIYVPPTAFARLLRLPVDLMTQVFVFGGAGVSIALCVRLASASDTAQDLGEVGLLAAVAALFVLPACAFAQRDHIALIAALPMLVVMGIRATGRRVDAMSAIVAGLGGGAMVVIRPHYAAAIGLAAVYVAWRRGLRSAALFPEFWAAGLVLVAYLATILLFFPAFLSDAFPMALAVYLPVKTDAQDLVLREPTGLIWATLATLALVYRRRVAAVPSPWSRRWRRPERFGAISTRVRAFPTTATWRWCWPSSPWRWRSRSRHARASPRPSHWRPVSAFRSLQNRRPVFGAS